MTPLQLIGLIAIAFAVWWFLDQREETPAEPLPNRKARRARVSRKGR